MRAVGFLVAAVLAGGCGDNAGPPSLTRSQLLARLRELPGVTVDDPEESPANASDGSGSTGEGLSYFVLHFTQPVDHGDPSSPTFQQQVSLLHRSDVAPVPMVVFTTGYSDFYRDKSVELTELLHANQVSIEHRYYGSSRPADPDWTKLSVEQMAADEHVIISALRTIYGGAFLSAGASKGGTTAVALHSLYPDDVDGTVAYVAPLTFGAPDTRYPAFFDTVGPAICRDAVRAAAIEMLANRRAAIEARAAAQAEHSYTRVSLPAAVEAAIVALEWSFWQYSGADACHDVPLAAASDDDLFHFLDTTSPIHENSDAALVDMEAYYYETYAQIGYPDDTIASLTPYRQFDDEAYDGRLPTAEPTYNARAMDALLDYVTDRDLTYHARRFLYIYGEWDPWTAGKFITGDATETATFFESRGTHAAQIVGLSRADRDAALAMLKDWTGVTPVIEWSHAAVDPPVRSPLWARRAP